jgi:hypothetical protein
MESGEVQLKSGSEVKIRQKKDHKSEFALQEWNKTAAKWKLGG